MKGIILAAGRSTRLYPITLEKPKCLLDVGGKSLLDRQIDYLKELGVSDIVVVTGYLNEHIEKVCSGKARCIYFPDFAKTNNLHTLNYISDELNDDAIVMFADVILDKNILKECVESEKDFCLVLEQDLVPETMRAKTVSGKIIDIGKHISEKEAEGNFIGIAKYSKKGCELLKKELSELAVDENSDSYYIIALNSLAKKGINIDFVGVNKRKWFEIDTVEDYEKAKQVFSELI